MKKFFKTAGSIVASCIITIAVLSAFCFFYNFDGGAIPDDTGAAPMRCKPHQIMGQMVEGFSLKRADENGFYNVPEAVSDHPQILLMGDSHVEAKQMATKYSMGALLNERYSTYSIGVSANELESCVAHLKNAVEAFAPTDYVILQTAATYLSMESMQQVLAGKTEEFEENNKIFASIPDYIPASTVLGFQLINWIETSDSFLPGLKNREEPQKPEDLSEEYKQVLDAFLQKAARDARGSGANLIIFRMAPYTVDPDGKSAEEPFLEQQALEVFRSSCEKYDIIFVDMRPAFESKYQNEKILPRGFCNTIPGDGHLNRQGHKIVADMLIHTIEALEQGA